jgi:hypothetical protein
VVPGRESAPDALPGIWQISGNDIAKHHAPPDGLQEGKSSAALG